MRLREIGWSLCLAGLPFAYLLVQPRLDLSHGQALWMQAWALILWAVALADGLPHQPPNWPLAAVLGWVWLGGFWRFSQGLLTEHQYVLGLWAPAGHLLIILFLYQAAMSQWTVEILERLLRWIARAGVLVMAYSILQLCGLDQFLKSIDPTQHTLSFRFVGTAGNISHYGAYLAFLTPILWHQPGKRWKAAAILAVGLLCLTTSIAAVCALAAACLFLAWYRVRAAFWTLLTVGLPGALAVAWTWPAIVNPHGRWVAWSIYWRWFHSHSILGLGQGAVYQLSQTITDGPLLKWRHVHNEYFQMAIENGVIGFGLTLWLLWEIWRRFHRSPKTPLALTCGAVFVAFLVEGVLNFPAHLWLLGSFGLVAYCGVLVCAREAAWPRP